MRGFYNNIPNHYSHELNIIINMLLQFNPNNRPTCNQILDNSIIKKKIESIFGFSGIKKKKEISNILPNKIKSVKSSKDIIKLLPKFNNYKNDNRKSFSKNDRIIYNNNSSFDIFRIWIFILFKKIMMKIKKMIKNKL